MHFHWMDTCKKIHLVRRYKRGISSKFIVMPFRPIGYVNVVLRNHYVLHGSSIKKTSYFQDVQSGLSQEKQVVKFFIHLHYILLCCLGKKDVSFDGDMDKTMSFYERLKMVQHTVQDQLEKDKYKYRYYVNHRVQVDGASWCQFCKKRLQVVEQGHNVQISHSECIPT